MSPALRPPCASAVSSQAAEATAVFNGCICCMALHNDLPVPPPHTHAHARAHILPYPNTYRCSQVAAEKIVNAMYAGPTKSHAQLPLLLFIVGQMYMFATLTPLCWLPLPRQSRDPCCHHVLGVRWHAAILSAEGMRSGHRTRRSIGPRGCRTDCSRRLETTTR